MMDNSLTFFSCTEYVGFSILRKLETIMNILNRHKNNYLQLFGQGQINMIYQMMAIKNSDIQ